MKPWKTSALQSDKLGKKNDGHRTQQDLADWTATSTKFISNVECGKETVRLDKVFDLLVVLDVRIYLSDGALFPAD